MVAASGTSSTRTIRVSNEPGLDQDFRIEGSTDQNLVRVDAGNDVVLLGTSLAQGTGLSHKAHINGNLMVGQFDQLSLNDAYVVASGAVPNGGQNSGQGSHLHIRSGIATGSGTSGDLIFEVGNGVNGGNQVPNGVLTALRIHNVTRRAHFHGEVELDADLNHDGSNVGFYGATPVAQASKINDPSGGSIVDSEARSAVNAIIDALEALGLTAAS